MEDLYHHGEILVADCHLILAQEEIAPCAQTRWLGKVEAHEFPGTCRGHGGDIAGILAGPQAVVALRDPESARKNLEFVYTGTAAGPEPVRKQFRLSPCPLQAGIPYIPHAKVPESLYKKEGAIERQGPSPGP